MPFGDIQIAVDAAEANRGGTIKIGPGTYTLTSAIEIMHSFVTLEGSGRTLCVPDLDHPSVGAVPCEYDERNEERRGFHPNGQMVAGTETRLAVVPGAFDADDPANANIQPVIKVGCGEAWRYVDVCPDVVLERITIRGLTLSPAPARGGAIDIRRVSHFELRGNIIEGAQRGVLATGSTGLIVGNSVSRIGACGLCISAPLPGGEDDNAPDVDLVGNTVNGATAAVFLFGATSGIRQLNDHLDADVRHNALRNAGLGARMSPEIHPAGSPGFSVVNGTITARFTGNEYSGNSSPYLFDNGFGFRRDVTGPGPFDFDVEGPSPCAPRWYTGTFDIRLTDEDVRSNNGPSEITFTRPYGSGWENWQYLHHATYKIHDPDDVLRIAEPIGGPLRARIDNPAYDAYQDLTPGSAPFLDACASERVYDVVGGPRLHPGTPRYATPTPLQQALGNTLVINGVVMPHLQGAEGGVDCLGPSLADCMQACADGRDNDGDGVYDWDDPDCSLECDADHRAGTGTHGSVDYTVSFGESGAFSTTVHGLAAADTSDGAVEQDPFTEPFDPPNYPAHGWTKQSVVVPVGTVHTRFALYDEYTDKPHEYDLDLVVLDSHEQFVGGSFTGTATEQVDLADPAPGTYDVWVNGYNTDEGIAHYRLFAYNVGGDASNLTVSGPAQVTAGQVGLLTAAWSGLASCTRYLGLVEHLVDGSVLRCQGETIEIATDTDLSCATP